VVALLVACGGAQKEDDARPEPDELDLDADRPPPPAPRQPLPSSSPAELSPAPPVTTRAGRFRGRLIDIDVKDADLHNVFRLIADAGGVSIAVADDVKGTITLRLRQVPWDQALDAVVKLEKLRLEQRGDIYLVTRPEKRTTVQKQNDLR
jgi:type II secretory pathway component HofQ